VVDI
jgi:dynein heavy chain